MNKTHISNLDYHLPKSSIAQDPYLNPEDSQILDAESMKIHKFESIDNVIPKRSLLVFNNSEVIDVRVKTNKKHTHGNVEIFILRKLMNIQQIVYLNLMAKRKLEIKLSLKILHKYYQKCK